MTTSAADAGAAEDRLGHDRAGEHRAELQAEHGDDRNERVLQPVAPEDEPLD